MLLHFKDLCLWLITALCCCAEGGAASSLDLDSLASRSLPATPLVCFREPPLLMRSVSYPQGVLGQGNGRLRKTGRLALGYWPGSRSMAVCHLQQTAVPLCLHKPIREGKRGILCTVRLQLRVRPWLVPSSPALPLSCSGAPSCPISYMYIYGLSISVCEGGPHKNGIIFWRGGPLVVQASPH